MCNRNHEPFLRKLQSLICCSIAPIVPILAGEEHGISESPEKVSFLESASRLFNISGEVAVNVNEISRKNQISSGMYLYNPT